MTYKEIKNNEEVNELLKKGDRNLGLLGYTDHSKAHCVRVAETAAHILKKFGYSEHEIELACIAGYMHDIGNAINRSRHAEYGGRPYFAYALQHLCAVCGQLEGRAQHIRCAAAHQHPLQKDLEVLVHTADVRVDLQIQRDDLFVGVDL